ncbi:MAG: pyridoxamine 5'-phosphate oxidase family protein [Anaerolineae bacterium]
MSRYEPKADVMGDYPSVSPLAWSEFVKLLTDHPAGTRWLSTVSSQGQVHATPIGAFFVNETYYFTSGQGTRKRANLDQNPSCSICLHTGGYDIVAEGTAAITRDEATIQQFVAFCQSVDWPVEAKGGVLEAPYHAPTTGPAPYDVYEMTFRKVFAYDTNNAAVNRSTRFTF